MFRKMWIAQLHLRKKGGLRKLLLFRILIPGSWEFRVTAKNEEDKTANNVLQFYIDKASPLLSITQVGATQPTLNTLSILANEPTAPQPQSGVKEKLCYLTSTGSAPTDDQWQNCDILAPNGVLSSLSPQNTYVLYVKARDNAGNDSSGLDTFSFTTPVLCAFAMYGIKSKFSE